MSATAKSSSALQGMDHTERLISLAGRGVCAFLDDYESGTVPFGEALDRVSFLIRALSTPWKVEELCAGEDAGKDDCASYCGASSTIHRQVFRRFARLLAGHTVESDAYSRDTVSKIANGAGYCAMQGVPVDTESLSRSTRCVYEERDESKKADVAARLSITCQLARMWCSWEMDLQESAWAQDGGRVKEATFSSQKGSAVRAQQSRQQLCEGVELLIQTTGQCLHHYLGEDAEAGSSGRDGVDLGTRKYSSPSDTLWVYAVADLGHLMCQLCHMGVILCEEESGSGAEVPGSLQGRLNSGVQGPAGNNVLIQRYFMRHLRKHIDLVAKALEVSFQGLEVSKMSGFLNAFVLFIGSSLMPDAALRCASSAMLSLWNLVIDVKARSHQTRKVLCLLLCRFAVAGKPVTSKTTSVGQPVGAVKPPNCQEPFPDTALWDSVIRRAIHEASNALSLLMTTSVQDVDTRMFSVVRLRNLLELLRHLCDYFRASGLAECLGQTKLPAGVMAGEIPVDSLLGLGITAARQVFTAVTGVVRVRLAEAGGLIALRKGDDERREEALRAEQHLEVAEKLLTPAFNLLGSVLKIVPMGHLVLRAQQFDVLFEALFAAHGFSSRPARPQRSMTSGVDVSPFAESACTSLILQLRFSQDIACLVALIVSRMPSYLHCHGRFLRWFASLTCGVMFTLDASVALRGLLSETSRAPIQGCRGGSTEIKPVVLDALVQIIYRATTEKHLRNRCNRAQDACVSALGQLPHLLKICCCLLESFPFLSVLPMHIKVRAALDEHVLRILYICCMQNCFAGGASGMGFPHGAGDDSREDGQRGRHTGLSSGSSGRPVLPELLSRQLIDTCLAYVEVSLLGPSLVPPRGLQVAVHVLQELQRFLGPTRHAGMAQNRSLSIVLSKLKSRLASVPLVEGHHSGSDMPGGVKGLDVLRMRTYCAAFHENQQQLFQTTTSGGPVSKSEPLTAWETGPLGALSSSVLPISINAQSVNGLQSLVHGASGIGVHASVSKLHASAPTAPCLIEVPFDAPKPLHYECDSTVSSALPSSRKELGATAGRPLCISGGEGSGGGKHDAFMKPSLQENEEEEHEDDEDDSIVEDRHSTGDDDYEDETDFTEEEEQEETAVEGGSTSCASPGEGDEDDDEDDVVDVDDRGSEMTYRKEDVERQEQTGDALGAESCGQRLRFLEAKNYDADRLTDVSSIVNMTETSSAVHPALTAQQGFEEERPCKGWEGKPTQLQKTQTEVQSAKPADIGAALSSAAQLVNGGTVACGSSVLKNAPASPCENESDANSSDSSASSGDAMRRRSSLCLLQNYGDDNEDSSSVAFESVQNQCEMAACLRYCGFSTSPTSGSSSKTSGPPSTTVGVGRPSASHSLYASPVATCDAQQQECCGPCAVDDEMGTVTLSTDTNHTGQRGGASGLSETGLSACDNAEAYAIESHGTEPRVSSTTMQQPGPPSSTDEDGSVPKSHSADMDPAVTMVSFKGTESELEEDDDAFLDTLGF